MRRIAPMIIASTLAFAGAAFAADNTGSPTVAPNTPSNQNNSYSDKSNTAKGTNAPMTDEAKAKAEADHAKMKAKKKLNKDGTPMTDSTTSSSSMGSASPSGTPANPAPLPKGTANSGSTDNSTTKKNGQ